MREIKFRGKSDGQWVYGSYVKTGVGLHYIIPQNLISNDVMQFKVNKDTVGQFTGLYDKNGREIYEGDILRHPPKNDWEEKNFVAFEVFYHDNNHAENHVGFQMNRLHFHGAYAGYYMTEKFLPRYTEGMIVIGNVFENPELVAKKNE